MVSYTEQALIEPFTPVRQLAEATKVLLALHNTHIDRGAVRSNLVFIAQGLVDL